MEEKIKELSANLSVSRSVARELLVLSGGDIAMAEQASKESYGLDQCKSSIINKRFTRLEKLCDSMN
jgi:hypothetical protein